jgi:Mrp family chromosome partitioning ATPase
MGIVYDAISKSGWQQGKSRATARKLQPENQVDEGEAPDRGDFDFVRYSLATPSVDELEQIQSDRAEETLARQMEARPARTVEVSLSQIDPHLVSFYDCDPRAADEYKKLANSLIASASDREIKRLLIASASHGDGRTLVTLNLACALAAARQRVLVVDADFKRPGLMRLLGIDTELGLAEALTRRLSAGSAALRVLPHGFVVLPNRDRVDNSAELLSSGSFEDLLRSLEADYDFILFDSAPLLDSEENRLLVRRTNAALLVVRPQTTSSGELGKAIAPLDQERVLGVILNRVS